MKRIFIIPCLFGLILNSFAQDEVKTDYLDVSTEILYKDVLFEDWMADSSGGTTGAINGLTKTGNDIGLKGTLSEDTDILGAGYYLNLGTVGSKLSTLQINTSGNILYNSDANIIFNPSGDFWTLDGSYWISDGGDTLATNAVVQALITAAREVLPFNWNYTFSSTITDSRPGVGLFRLNNATLSNVTEIYIDYFDSESVSQALFIAAADTGSYITVESDVNNYALYKVTAGYLDNGNYFTYKVTYQGHSGVISGLNTLDLEINNTTGTGSGGATAFFERLRVDTVSGYDNPEVLFIDPIVAESVTANDSVVTDSILLPNTKMGYGSGNGFRISNTDAPYESILYLNGQLAGISGGILGFNGSDFIGLVSNSSTYLFNNDTLFADGTGSSTANAAKFDNITSNSQTLNGTTIDTTFASQYIMQETVVDSIQVNKTIRYNESEGVHEFLTGKDEVVWQGALEDLVQVYNNTGSIVANGTPFFLSVSNGDTIATIGIASANLPQAKALQGLITGEVGIGDWGFGAVRGKVRGLNTASLSLSGVTWLSDDSTFTATAPVYPSEKVIIGGAISIHATEGVIYVSPSLGFVRQLDTKSYSFTSSSIAAGEYWKAGFYDAPVADANLTQASASITYGTADIAYEAHPFAVYGGVGSVTGGGRVALITTGTSYDDATGTQTPADVDTIINDITNSVLNIYDEAKKYLGTVTYQLVIVEGAPSAYSLDFNYGYAKYDDINDRDFYITALECVWLGDGTDATGFDVELYKHTQTGWTYSAAAFSAGDGIIAARSTDQAGFLRVVSGQESAWKRSALNTFIDGTGEEGFLVKVTTGSITTIQTMDIHVEVAID